MITMCKKPAKNIKHKKITESQQNINATKTLKKHKV